MSADDPPASTSYVPAATRHALVVSSQYAKADGSRSIETSFVSPGDRDVRAKPLSSLGGRGTDPFGGGHVHCTISSPDRLPRFVTAVPFLVVGHEVLDRGKDSFTLNAPYVRRRGLPCEPWNLAQVLEVSTVEG